MIKKTILILLAICFTATIASAEFPSWWNIEDDDAIVVTWQKGNGKWKACGPSQRLSTSYRDEDRVIDLVTMSSDYFMATQGGYMGRYEDYKIYSLGRKIGNSEYDARRCID